MQDLQHYGDRHPNKRVNPEKPRDLSYGPARSDVCTENLDGPNIVIGKNARIPRKFDSVGATQCFGTPPDQ